MTTTATLGITVGVLAAVVVLVCVLAFYLNKSRQSASNERDRVILATE